MLKATPERDSDLDARYKALKSAADPDRLHEYIETAEQLRQAGAANLALELLEPHQDTGARDASFNFVMALAYRDAQDLEGAFARIESAKHLAPGNADIAFAAAQLAFESWRPAISLFEEALSLAPANLSILKNLSITLAEEGRAGQAIDLLGSALAERSGWIEGHRQLASICVTSGASRSDESFEAACGCAPDDMSLRLAWFQHLCQAKQWEGAQRVLDDGRGRFDGQIAFRFSDIYLRAESGGCLSEDDLWGAHAARGDPGFDLCRVRYLLRTGDVERARAIAERHIESPNAKLFWPYLSLCWRVLNDARFEWLERGGAFVEAGVLTQSGVELSELAEKLRALHAMRRPYLEQSVRGGTQTGRNLFFHHDSLIQRLRRRVTEAVRDYAKRLVVDDNRHPFLRARPQDVRFTGSWSVLLRPNGFHVAHTHVLGWLSSVLYVSVPEEAELGEPPAGYLCFGAPPPELGLGLQTVHSVPPKAGLLVLFPSLTWHGAEPFQSGERLTIAFDVAPG